MAAAARHPGLRGDRGPRGRLRRSGRRSRPADGRGAAVAARPAAARAAPRGEEGARRPRSDDQRRPARPAGPGLEGGGPRARDGEPRHALARAVPVSRALRRARARACRHRRRRRSRIDAAQDRLRSDPRRQRRGDPGSPRLRPPRRGRSAIHRVHGRRRRDPLVPGARRAASRDPRADRAGARPDRGPPRRGERAGRAIPAAGRVGLRDHRFDDRALLPRVRPEPPDGRRPLVSLPLRDEGRGSARAAARGRVAGGSPAA